MKRMYPLFCSLFLACTGSFVAGNASYYDDSSFEKEKMLVSFDTVFVLSNTYTQDCITAYSHYGSFLWQTNFDAKVISWQLSGYYLFVFSKDRITDSTYLTCLDSYTGRVIWEKP